MNTLTAFIRQHRDLIVEEWVSRAATLPSGKALFYDIPLSTAATPRQSYMETDLGDSPMGFMNNIAMSRIQITADGRVCAYATRVSLGAIMSFWTTRDANKHPVYGYRKTDPTPSFSTNGSMPARPIQRKARWRTSKSIGHFCSTRYRR